MFTKFIEATDKTEFNWGKFAVCRFEPHEWERPSEIDGGISLLAGRGWTAAHVLVLDLQTGESAIFLPRGSVPADLEKHAIWVCPMFEPFLVWLYQQDLSDLSKLPGLVNLGDVPTALSGYRRAGKGKVDAT